MADAGRIVIIPKGEYKSNITYERLDAVEYNNNGYIALKTVTGITPTNDGTNWALYVKGTPVDSELSTTSTNAIQNKIVTAELSALKKENTQQSAEINDVKKETTVNLLNPTLQTTTQDEVTCTNNGNGTYTLNGTATDSIDFSLTSSLNIVNGKEYLLSFPSPSRAARAYLLNGQGVVEAYGNHTAAFKYIGETSSNKVVHLLIEKGYTCNNLIVKPMITTNLSATYDDFVPYTGDTGSLNKDVASLLKRIQALESQFASATSELCSNAIDDLASVVSTQDEAIDELATIVTESEEK